MTVIKKNFDSYSIVHSSNNSGYEADIACFTTGTTNMIGRIIFFKDGAPVPPNVSLAYGPEIHFPLSRLREVVDTLRQEKPLYLWLDTDSLVGAVGTTDKEPAGEEEG
ncbi:hypothetical protein [Saccharothrix syringae]|uniref:Uncharacterized protein n=1 Tax=Saccharothrix syringae TaxID=103733 RepID=A0A5Q0H4A0_SACSY|nr:hypothetical protein [Saccharothrix syringae]QFZ20745.1 hypothetical protein EKG83_28080 [Saccharothrix syringae]